MAVAANELRIGNWVYYGESIRPITSIHVSAQRSAVGVDNLITLFDVIKPIPLTPEILDKCGFEKYYNPERDHRREWWSIEHFTLEIYDAKIECVSLTSNPRVFVQYLHSLQNLFFALTNTELVYKP